MVVVVAVVTAQVLVPQKDEQNAQPLDEVFVILDYRESLIHTIIVFIRIFLERFVKKNDVVVSKFSLPTTNTTRLSLSIQMLRKKSRNQSTSSISYLISLLYYYHLSIIQSTINEF